MSDSGPDEPTEPIRPVEHVEHTVPLGSYETAGPAGPTDGGGSRRTVIAGVAAAVVALLAGGAYAGYSLLNGGGVQPAEVLPTSTVAVVSIDLDPSAGQKIAAIKSIRKFPALKKSLGLKADDDLRQLVFDKVIDAGHCKGLDFDRDVKPWLGKRAALAAVDLGRPHPTPVIALQISDSAKAQKGFQALVDCTDPQDLGFAVGDDYLVASDSATHAKTVLDMGASKPLADDASYQKWTGKAGDAGVVNFYVAPKAADQLTGFLDDMGSGALGFDPFSTDDSTSDDPLGPTKDALKGFKGMGGAVRFSSGGLELSLAGGGISQFNGLSPVGRDMGDLPSDTAAALGFGVSKDFADNIVKGMAGSEGSQADAEKETGLSLPEDLQTLLGRAITLSLGGDAPASFDDVKEPADVPAGLVIHGDAARIRTLISTVEDHVGTHLSDIPLVVDGTDDKVVVATSRAYADQLLATGKLGSQGNFSAAVPEAAKSNGVLFLDFDSAWRDTLAGFATGETGSGTEKDADANIKPLRALGFSSWEDGDVTHALLKVTTD